MTVSCDAPDDAATAAARALTVLDAADWPKIAADLDQRGYAIIEGLIDTDTCRAIAASYPDDSQFRSHIHMARHGFGRGEYKYFAYPLPGLIGALRQAFYARLAPTANAWAKRLSVPERYPAAHADFLAECHAAGQVRPTPLLLRYEAGDYNCLHQDLYGATAFPLQTAILLSAPGRDFCGGEFLLVEQRPRMQSRASVVPLGQGDAVIFAVNHRPAAGKKGDYRVTLRHGVSEIRSGNRHTLGLIFHDAT